MNTYEPTSVRDTIRDLIAFPMFTIATRIMSPEGKRFLKQTITEKVLS